MTTARRMAPLLSLLLDKSGPLTRELHRKSAGFGLGQLPERLIPDRTTSMICGFCSTGCSLDVHLREGKAVNLTPAVDYPVNLGMACPKGWEALTPLAAGDGANALSTLRRKDPRVRPCARPAGGRS